MAAVHLGLQHALISRVMVGCMVGWGAVDALSVLLHKPFTLTLPLPAGAWMCVSLCSDAPVTHSQSFCA